MATKAELLAELGNIRADATAFAARVNQAHAEIDQAAMIFAKTLQELAARCRQIHEEAAQLKVNADACAEKLLAWDDDEQADWWKTGTDPFAE